MASNRYDQFSGQQPPTQRYDARQFNQQAGQLHGRRNHQQYDRYYEDTHNWNEQVARQDRNTGQNGRWDDQPYQGQQQQGINGYTSHQLPTRGKSQEQVYQYDERYHTQGGGNPRQFARRQDEAVRSSTERHRPGQIDLNKANKPRERILTEPLSPDLIAWDNPFPTFNLKKKGDQKKHSSLDKGFGKTNIQDTRYGESRPHTSQDHRRQGDSRPHTSAGHRQPDQGDFKRPAQPSTPMSPVQKASPVFHNPNSRLPDRQEIYDDPVTSVRPSLNPLHPSGQPQFPSNFQPRPGPRTQPAPSLGLNASGNFAGGISERNASANSTSQAQWREPQQARGNSGWQNDEADHDRGDSSVFPPAQRSRSYESGPPNVRGTGITRNQPGSFETEGMQQYPSEAHVRPNEAFQVSEMPNFDAIPTSMSEKSEVQIPTNQANVMTLPAYQKKIYQALPPIQPPVDQKSSGAGTSWPPNNPQSPFAEFQFDLPANGLALSSRMPVSQANESSYGEPDRKEYRPDSRTRHQHPDMADVYGQQAQPSAMQFPPRGASRAEQHPRPASATQTFRPPASHRFEQRSASDTQQYPPTGPARQHSFIPSDGNGYEQSTVEQQRRSQSSQTQLPQDYPSNRDDMYSPPPPRTSLEQGYRVNAYGQNQGPRSMTLNPSRPPPIRQYDQRSISAGGQNQYERPNVSQSPDALPAHPVPVRAGLIKQSTANTVQGAGPQQPSSNIQQQPSDNQKPPPRSSKEAGRRSPPVTAFDLNLLQQKYRANPNDHEAGLKLAKKLVEAASVLSNEGGRADAKTTAKNREKYILDAHKTVKKLVGAGYPEAMFYLADCHGQGLLGLAPDPKEAFALYQSAAKLGHPPSAYRVAVCCEMGAEEGGGTRRDPLKAIQWYKRAATLGDTPAMYKMGMTLLKGLLGQPRNPREALSWLKRAAERADEENPHALHELGLLYESAAPNDAIIRDENYSRQLFLQAAELGYKYSQFRLGSAYEYGMLGCPVDPRQSVAWYSRAAVQGEHQSELALSGWYLTGSESIPLQQSDTEAYLWARKAATSGLAKAEYAMGYFTEVGIGAPANIEEAKRWYWRAASQNFSKARERLEDLKKGGVKMQKTRLSRSAVNKQTEGECVLM